MRRTRRCCSCGRGVDRLRNCGGNEERRSDQRADQSADDAVGPVVMNAHGSSLVEAVVLPQLTRSSAGRMAPAVSTSWLSDGAARIRVPRGRCASRERADRGWATRADPPRSRRLRLRRAVLQIHGGQCRRPRTRQQLNSGPSQSPILDVRSALARREPGTAQGRSWGSTQCLSSVREGSMRDHKALHGTWPSGRRYS
jgi:hypothetical protein